jgi:hypothetical protein
VRTCKPLSPSPTFEGASTHDRRVSRIPRRQQMLLRIGEPVRSAQFALSDAQRQAAND